MLRAKKLAVLGAGKLGETLIRGLTEAGVVDVKNIVATAGHQPRLDQLQTKFGIRCTLSNRQAASKADIVLLSVKPQSVPIVVSEISEVMTPSQLLISVAASVSTVFIEKHLAAAVPVIRAMPNTPCLINKGMTGLAPGKNAHAEHVADDKSA